MLIYEQGKLPAHFQIVHNSQELAWKLDSDDGELLTKGENMQHQKAKRIMMATVASVSLATTALGSAEAAISADTVSESSNAAATTTLEEQMPDAQLFLQLQRRLDPTALGDFDFPSMEHGKCV